MASGRTRLALAASLAVPVAMTPVHGGTGAVDIAFAPTDQTVDRCDLVEIDLIVTSAGGVGQEFDALDAILSWDPGILEFIALDDSNAGASFFVSSFLPDPDGINDDVSDGEALYTAFATPGFPVTAPVAPGDLIVTTLVFRAVSTTPGTTLVLTPTVGSFGETRVLLGGLAITGDISGTSSATIGTCIGDLNSDSEVGFVDLTALLGVWGPCPVECCPADFDNNGDVGFTDLTLLLGVWGPCP